MSRDNWTGALAVILVTALAGAARGAPAERPITYAAPPERVVWLEGEECPEHNWTTGPTSHCWAFAWAGIHGGVLDLASWRLPDAGAFTARFPFRVPDSGAYLIYYLGRSTYQGSPFKWAVDAAEPQRYPPPGKPHSVSEVAHVANIKYAVTRLGPVELQAGAHTLTFIVDEPAVDRRPLPFYSQQIDAVAISRAGAPQVGAPPPTREAAQRSGAVELWGSSGTESTETSAAIPAGEAAPSKKLQAGGLSLELSPGHAGLRSLRTAGKGIAIASAPAPAPLVTVRMRSGQTAFLGSLKWSPSGDGLAASGAGKGFSAALSFQRTPAGEVALRLRLANTAREPIEAVRWSVLDGVSLGGAQDDDEWFVGSNDYRPAQVRDVVSLISPTLKFDWVCLFDRSIACYAYFQDRDLLDTRVFFSGRGGARGTGRLVFEKYPRIDPGASWQAPPLVLGAYERGDWHPAADRFRDWWYSWAKTPRIPEWFRSIGALGAGGTVFGNRSAPEESRVPLAIQANADLLARARGETGITFFHTADWLPFQTEAWYPANYELTPLQLQDLRSILRAAQRAGARFNHYSNPLMFSRVVPQFELFGERLAARARDGRIYLTEHTHRHHPMALPYPGEEWARRFADSIERAVLLGGMDGLYLDQLGAVPAHLDYSTTTGHHHYGEWVAGSARFARLVTDRLRQANPDLVTGIECPSPAVQQHVTYALLAYGKRAHAILRYTFPTYVNFVGQYDGAGDEGTLAFAREALVTGQPLLYRGGARDPQVLARLRAIILLKQRWDPLLYACQYRDTVGLRAPEGVLARVFTHPDGRALIPFARAAASAEGDLAVEPKALGLGAFASARCVAVDNPAAEEAWRLGSGDGVVRVPLPAAEAGLLILAPAQRQ